MSMGQCEKDVTSKHSQKKKFTDPFICDFFFDVIVGDLDLIILYIEAKFVNI